jgi:hypothetical protein
MKLDYLIKKGLTFRNPEFWKLRFLKIRKFKNSEIQKLGSLEIQESKNLGIKINIS